MNTTELLFALFVLLQVLDGWTTYTIIGKQGGRELAGVAKFFISTFGIYTGLLILKTVAIGLGIALLVSGEWIWLTVIDLFYLWVVVHNLEQMR